MTQQEIITELEYLIERGVPPQIESVFCTIMGTIQTGDNAVLTELMRHNQMFSTMLLARTKK